MESPHEGTFVLSSSSHFNNFSLLLQQDYFTGINTLSIWSDGGPKHFCLSANMWILHVVQDYYPDILFSYNFFASVFVTLQQLMGRRGCSQSSAMRTGLLTQCPFSSVSSTPSNTTMPLPLLSQTTLSNSLPLTQSNLSSAWTAPFSGKLWAWPTSAREGQPTVFNVSDHLYQEMPVLFVAHWQTTCSNMYEPVTHIGRHFCICQRSSHKKT